MRSTQNIQTSSLTVPFLSFRPSTKDNVTLPVANGGAVGLIQSKWFDFRKPTLCYFHGFGDRPDNIYVQSMAQAIMRRGGWNFLFLDWSTLTYHPGDTTYYAMTAAPDSVLVSRSTECMQLRQTWLIHFVAFSARTTSRKIVHPMDQQRCLRQDIPLGWSLSGWRACWHGSATSSTAIKKCSQTWTPQRFGSSFATFLPTHGSLSACPAHRR